MATNEAGERARRPERDEEMDNAMFLFALYMLGRTTPNEFIDIERIASAMHLGRHQAWPIAQRLARDDHGAIEYPNNEATAYRLTEKGKSLVTKMATAH